MKQDRETATPVWRQWIASAVEKTLNGVDRLGAATWRPLGEHLGFGGAQHIAAYRGYANDAHVWVNGRLLGSRPFGGPRDTDNWWDNIKATWHRWESDEVPGAVVTLRYAGQSIDVTTDDEGFYSATFSRDIVSAESDYVEATHVSRHGRLSAQHWIAIPDTSARYMIISDVDDTVIHTGLTDLKTAAELTFLNNAKTRQPLEGVAGLYTALTTAVDAPSRNPIFYVSNSAWNMYDLLRDFLELNDLPRGPLLLRDLDLVDMISGKENTHKRDRIEALLQRIALPAILIGDSGQHDASLYADIASRYPGRVLAVYIRDVDPDADSRYDVKVAKLIDDTHLDGIPFRLVRSSVDIANDLVRVGLLPADETQAVAASSSAEAGRETVAEQAGRNMLSPDG